jgi:hypothetical protein
MDSRDGKIKQEKMYMLELKIDSMKIHNKIYSLELSHNKPLNIILLNNSSSNHFNLQLNQCSNLTNLLLFTLNHLKFKYLPFMDSNLQFKPLFMPNLLQSSPLCTANQLQFNHNLFMLSQLQSTPNNLQYMLNPHQFIMSLNLNILNQNLLFKLIKVSDPHMQMRTLELGIQELF